MAQRRPNAEFRNIPPIDYGTTVIDIVNPPTPENLANPMRPALNVTFQLAYTGDRVEIEYINTDLLYAVIVETFRNLFRNFTPYQQRRVTAVFTVSNQANGKEDSVAPLHVLNPLDFTPDMIGQLHRAINNSGEDIDPASILYEFSFVFSSYARLGGFGKPAEGWTDVFMPFSEKVIANNTHRIYEDDVGPLCCIAMALAYWMVRCRHWEMDPPENEREPRKLKSKRAIQLMGEKARALMREFVWHEVEPLDVLHQFVEAYPQYRIVVFQNQNRNCDVFEGRYWVNPIDPNNR